MLEQLQSSDFSPHIEKSCRLECDGAVIEAVLQSVDEMPAARRSKAAPGNRAPFTLLLRAAPDCQYAGGTFTLKIEGMAEIPDLYTNRIMHTGPDSMFQVIFN